MFTVAVYGVDYRGAVLGSGFGFVTCLCKQSFQFDMRIDENTIRVGDTRILICPHCKHTSNQLLILPYVDADGISHGSFKYTLVYGQGD